MVPTEQLQRLAAFEPSAFPVLSLYLNTASDDHGRAHFAAFIRKEFATRGKTYPASSEERHSFDADAARIESYIENDLQASTNGLVIFACSGEQLFEAVQLQVPVKEHALHIFHQPYLFPLALLHDEYPRHAALIADGHRARLVVFGIDGVESNEEIEAPHQRHRVKVGGWSQARYQRRLDNAQQEHARELMEELAKVVEQEKINHILLAADDVMMPILKAELPANLVDKVLDLGGVDTRTAEQEVLIAALEALKDKAAETDQEKVQRLLNEVRGGGLGVTGMADTLAALEGGQVDELVITAEVQQVEGAERVKDALEPLDPPSVEEPQGTEQRTELAADLLVTKAQQTGAAITFIQDTQLLADVGGVGAILRYALPRVRTVLPHERRLPT